MAVAWTDLREYVGAPDSEQPYLETCLETATSLVTAYIGTAEVPANVLDSALLEVGAKLYARKGSTGGYTAGETTAAPSVLVARDPMVTVYPTLNPFLVRL